MKKNLILFLCLVSFKIASESNIVIIEGKIKSFNKDFVNITSAKGAANVPRKYIPPKVKLSSGENIRIPLTEEQVAIIK